MTDIVKGDLYDEVQERLKLCQGELTTTKRQVTVLQEKLIENAQIKVLNLFIFELSSGPEQFKI